VVRSSETGWYYATCNTNRQLLTSATGQSWSALENDVNINARLVEFDGWIVAVLDDNRLLSVKREGDSTTERYHSLLFAPAPRWNVTAVGGDGYLYVIDNRLDGGVWRSNDLSSWTLWTETGDGPSYSVAYWPSRNRVVVAGSAILWEVTP
jgi:hypothetical protein